jgi:hypothetical protein
MKNLKNSFCFTGPVESNLYIKFHMYWNKKLGVLPKFQYSDSSMLSFQIADIII